MRITEFAKHMIVDSGDVLVYSDEKQKTELHAVMFNDVENKAIMSTLLTVISFDDGSDIRILPTTEVSKYINEETCQVINDMPEYSKAEHWRIQGSFEKKDYEEFVKIDKELVINETDDIFIKKVKQILNTRRLEFPKSREDFYKNKIREIEKGTASYPAMMQLLNTIGIEISDVKFKRKYTVEEEI